MSETKDSIATYRDMPSDERFAAMLKRSPKHLYERLHILTTGLANDATIQVGDIRAAMYCDTRPLTEKEMAHALELAEKHGWFDGK